MPQYFVAAEAQNFAASLFDTEDLSTIRGASILCLDLIRKLSDHVTGLTVITVGASSGLWQFEAADDDEASKLAGTIENHLTRGNAQHFTFGVAHLAAAGRSLIEITDALRARLRRAQLRSAGLAYPNAGPWGEACPIDLLRPVGKEQIWIATKKAAVSDSVSARRKHGVDRKQSFLLHQADASHKPELSAIIGNADTAPFALLLSSISESGAPPKDLKSNLTDKIAVIHLDGNSFGAAQTALLEPKERDGLAAQIEAQTHFDEKLACFRSRLVTEILDHLANEGGCGRPSMAEGQLREERNKEHRGLTPFRLDSVLRFEMLLWGGDEMTFIVPARLGWQITELIAAEVSTWQVLDEPLSAAIGLVYCHHDAPIARIRALADELATHLKGTKVRWDGQQRDGRAQTLIFPLVLESFDHIGNQLGDFLMKRTPPAWRVAGAAAKRDSFFAIEAADLSVLRSLAKELRSDPAFSRRRLRALAQAAHDNRAYKKDISMLSHLAARTGAVIDGSKASLAVLGDPTDNYRRSWMLLEDWWDYLLPCDDLETGS